MVEFYVYELIDPRNHTVFYVGKGSHKRMYQHVVEARKKHHVNSKLQHKILKILSSGLDVRYRKIFVTLDESQAYNFEKKQIAKLGLKTLCNLHVGGRGGCQGKLPKYHVDAIRSSRQRSEVIIHERMARDRRYGKQISEDVRCPRCDKIFHREYREKTSLKNIKQFCSQTCANSRTFSHDLKKQISAKLLGRVLPESTKDLISCALRSRELSPEHKMKISRSMEQNQSHR
jgi:hypothetical protein